MDILDVVAHPFNPSTGGAETEDLESLLAKEETLDSVRDPDSKYQAESH